MTETEHAFFECPRCGHRTHDDEHMVDGYCSVCHDFTGMTLVQVEGDLPTPIGRVQTGLAVIDGQTEVVITLYDTVQRFTPVASYRLPAEVARLWAQALERAATAADEDDAVRDVGR